MIIAARNANFDFDGFCARPKSGRGPIWASSHKVQHANFFLVIVYDYYDAVVKELVGCEVVPGPVKIHLD